jgi:hypothetical protein
MMEATLGTRLSKDTGSCTIAVCALVVASGCASTPIYRSSGPAERGEIAIASDIELATEVDFGSGSLGVLFVKERSHSGVAQNVLFVARSGPAGRGSADVSLYSLRRTASVSLEQARRLLVAIDTFLALAPESLGRTKMFNFELSAGPVDVSVGSSNHHPFIEITFSVIYSVTNAGKYFALVVPSPDEEKGFWTLELKQNEVKALREAIDAAIAKVG